MIDENLVDRFIITTHLARTQTKLTRLGRIDQISQFHLISCFGAVNCDEALVNSFTIYTKPLQAIEGYGLRERKIP